MLLGASGKQIYCQLNVIHMWYIDDITNSGIMNPLRRLTSCSRLMNSCLCEWVLYINPFITDCLEYVSRQI